MQQEEQKSQSQTPISFENLVPLESEASSHPIDHTSSALPTENQLFYQKEEEEVAAATPPHGEGTPSSLAYPLQSSAALHSATLSHFTQPEAASQTPPFLSSQNAPRRSSLPALPKVFLVISTIVLVGFTGILFVLSRTPAPTSVPHTTTQIRPTNQLPPHATQTNTRHAPNTPHTTPTPSNQQAAGATTPALPLIPTQQTLTQLGWTSAGLTVADAVEAQRIATAFTDLEMSYDYRNIGSPTQHSGTFTDSTSLLTQGAKLRFVKNDVRMINNTLYNQVHDAMIIQQVLAPQGTLAAFQTQQIQGKQQQFAWVKVSFERFQTKKDMVTGNRITDSDLDPATGRARTHQMIVVLVRTSPEQQGPLGGIGWLVNNYALDGATPSTIATIPTL